jgi:hypothetical protein
MLDSSIPLQVKPVEINSPMQTMGQIMQMRNMGQEIQARQQQMQLQQAQMQEYQQKVQQQQQDLDAQNTIKQQSSDPANVTAWANGDYSSLQGKIDQKYLQNMETTRQSQIKTKVGTDAEQLKNEDSARVLVANALNGLKSLPDDASAVGQYPIVKANLLKQLPYGVAGTVNLPDSITSKKDLDPLAVTNLAHQEFIKQGMAQQEQEATLSEKQNLAKKAANEVITGTPNAAGLTPNQQATIDSKSIPLDQQQAELEKKVATGKATADDQQSLAAIKKTRTLGQQTTFNLNSGAATPTITGNTREEKLAQVPANIRGLVSQALDYRGVMPSGFAMGKPPWSQVFNAVAQIDPTWDAKEFPMRQRIMNSFTSGKDAAQIQATNTLANHLDILGQAATALKNGNVQVLNKIANYMGVQTGSTPATTLKTIVHRVGPEITQAYVGTGGEFAERKANEGDFSDNMSPDQLLNNVGVTVKLLNGKTQGQVSKWKQGMSRDDFALHAGGPSFITPQVQAVFDKYGTGGSTQPAASQQKSYSHTATGQNGHKIGSNDGQQWFDIQTGKQVQ